MFSALASASPLRNLSSWLMTPVFSPLYDMS